MRSGDTVYAVRCDDVGARMEGHGTGVRARLITYDPDGYRSKLTAWKDATPVSAALTKASMVGWTWKGGKKFAHGTSCRGSRARYPPIAGPCGKNR
ncbi:hypothetical protein ACFWBF_19705 [Streptomyces sp. NPDC060028]|uniref:hypothetical protein n=1 Tax=Streptomyces sp. NPDC060028 TaxID=3347041 RepID=UPI003699375D